MEPEHSPFTLADQVYTDLYYLHSGLSAGDATDTYLTGTDDFREQGLRLSL